MNQAEHAFYTDLHRLECEVRYVLQSPAAGEYLDKVQAKRGKDARTILETQVRERRAEARRILALTTIKERRECLAMAEQTHGIYRRETLEQEIMKQWKESKN